MKLSKSGLAGALTLGFTLTAPYLFSGGCGPGIDPGNLHSTTFTPLNFRDGARVHAGLLLGRAQAGVGVALIEYRFDGEGDFEEATGTAEWSVPLPAVAVTGTFWKTDSRHTVEIRAVGPTGEILDSASYTLTKGRNTDFNRDGYSDLGIGYCNGEGTACVYLGSAAGLSEDPQLELEDPLDTQNGVYGQVIAPAGDVNGDGYGDLVIADPRSDGGGGAGAQRGAIWIHHGSSSGVSSTIARQILEPSANNLSLFGSSVDGAGDVNADGYDDIVVGAIASSDFDVFDGAAYVYHGSSAGISATFAQDLEYPGGTAAPFFGKSVAGVGDIDGDGFSDIAVGAPDSGSSGVVYVYHGSASGIPDGVETEIDYPESDGSSEFGSCLSSAGDVNADGYADLVVGAPSSNSSGSNEGAAYVHNGSSSGLASVASTRLLYPGSTASAAFGTATGASDVNGDGFDDVLIGAETAREAFVYLGTGTGTFATAATMLSDSTASSLFGTGILGLGDFNGDGFGDAAISAPAGDDDDSFTRGIVGDTYIHHGSGGGLASAAATSFDL